MQLFEFLSAVFGKCYSFLNSSTLFGASLLSIMVVGCLAWIVFHYLVTSHD